jgi:hypothetical protein
MQEVQLFLSPSLQNTHGETHASQIDPLYEYPSMHEVHVVAFEQVSQGIGHFKHLFIFK